MSFKLENEDMVLIVGGIIAMIQTGFQFQNPAFTLGAISFLKGILSCFVPGTVK